MVKRLTFWEAALAAGLLLVGGACGLAIARDKLVLKYLPVDHDIEMVTQDNTSNPIILNETKGTAEIRAIITAHKACLTCREYDRWNASQCPNCCVMANDTPILIHCQDASDTACPNPGPPPFNNITVNCTTTFDRNNCGACPKPCAKYPEAITHCQRCGCPDTAAPQHISCKPDPGNATTWYCGVDDAPTKPILTSTVIANKTCEAYRNNAYVIEPVNDSFCDPKKTTTGNCWKYTANPDFIGCIKKCKDAADEWEDTYYNYNNGTLGGAVCNRNCTSGFNRNCDATVCRQKIDEGCFGNFTTAKCVPIENNYQELLMGGLSDHFVDIAPEFEYKFVARNGEKYMAGWQVLCNVVKGTQEYNFYTMIKVLDQDTNRPVYESVVHQKSLGSTFYINAQTGFSFENAPDLKTGHGYKIKIFYFLPWDGENHLEVDVSLLQLILYRTKN